MKLSFHGAARTVTGSKHLLTLDNGKKILIDCGLFQGMGSKTDDLNNDFGFEPSSIDVLIVTHAHIDHTGLIPKLVKDGFNGKIYSTPATKDLAEILMYDSAEIQTYEIDYINKKRAAKNLPPYEPLYSSEHVQQAVERFEVQEYEQWFKVDDDVEVRFTHTGHLIGSAAIHLRVKENGKTKTVTFSGDVGRYNSMLLKSPADFEQSDYIILESTYGDKAHDMVFNTVDTLRDWVRKTCHQKGGKLIIPAFSVGRTQEVLYALNQLSIENRLPELFYFVDSPLSSKATKVVKSYTDEYNDKLQKVLTIDDDPFDFPGLKYVETVEESKQLVDYEEPCVIISASGTADAGRVRHHINSCIGNANNTILMVGYCERYSLGGQLLAGDPEVEIFGDPCTVMAEIGQMKSMSAHGDNDDLCKFVSCQDPEKVKGIFLVHGEYSAQQELAARLKRKMFENIVTPSMHEEVELS
ncbi:MBL fold metallo-hydrolase [Aridibaculum aurantiacum]|uniref:MBL fold metallo-hydrolase n=1 Tax=Aridibaculum aurantiacum TaxID=2810307 RepID=UPI001A95CC49|nr:MBL fold metallo-hydrolase [Aridibaculum aurantiacum]